MEREKRLRGPTKKRERRGWERRRERERTLLGCGGIGIERRGRREKVRVWGLMVERENEGEINFV